jgi:hypothetical protein
MLALVLMAAAAQVQAAADLNWLAGAWVSEQGERWAEEWWTPARGGVLIGGGRLGAGERLSAFEHMRIMTGPDGRLAFHGQPGGTPAVAFPLVSAGPNRAEFANPAHDYPQRIVYERRGDTLTATISMMDGSKRVSWTFGRR